MDNCERGTQVLLAQGSETERDGTTRQEML
jgi:hypothetical protein